MRKMFLLRNRRGMTLVEILVGMTIFAIGLLSLSRVMFGVMHSNLRSKHTVIATNLAHQRMEQVIGAMRYDSITQTQYPEEAYGQVDNANTEYAGYRRTVAIADSLDSIGNSVMKEIMVRVEWRESGDTRNIELRSSISRFKDINL